MAKIEFCWMLFPMQFARNSTLCLAGQFLLLLGLAVFAAPAWAGLPAPVRAALAQAGMPQTHVAVFVQDVAQTEPLIFHNADAAMNPASVMKVLTTYAGLELLGPAYRWKTEAYATGPLEDGVLYGDLVLQGYGDPALTLERFWLLLQRVQAAGIRRIDGDLVLDASFFDLPPEDPGAFDARPLRAYNVGPNALLVNFKAVQLSFTPDPHNQVVRVMAEPALSGLQIDNRLKLTDEPCQGWKDSLGLDFQAGDGVARIVLGGSYSSACGEKVDPIAVLSHADYVGALFRTLWGGMGGSLRGSVRAGSAGEGARRLAEIESPPLADVIRDINKFSNNVMARQLFLTLGAQTQGPPGTVEKSKQAVRRWLAEKSLDFPELELENGSGLSRLERISARHVGELLLTAYRGPLMPELLASLPIASVDGTMQRRLHTKAVAGQARVKTGSLEGVRTLAGYLLDRRGRTWVFVCLINHPDAAVAREAEDALLLWLHEREG